MYRTLLSGALIRESSFHAMQISRPTKEIDYSASGWGVEVLSPPQHSNNRGLSNKSRYEVHVAVFRTVRCHYRLELKSFRVLKWVRLIPSKSRRKKRNLFVI
jgi:hypothetical protein